MRRRLLGGSMVLLGGCGGGDMVMPSPSVVVGTPTVVATALTVILHGEPARSFGGGRWRVCDTGTVHNGSALVAHDVRVMVTYLNHGAVDGQTTRDDATANGGALGDIAAAQSRDFTVCGYARNEPDRDVVTAVPAP
jgi:hypothetical protein